jgi:hypothetical protein
MRIPRPSAPLPATLLAFALVLSGSWASRADPEAPASVDAVPAGVVGSVDEVLDCVELNAPKESSEQLVEFTAFDRIGGKRVSRAKILGKRFESDSMRRVLLRFTKPLEVRGSAFLAIEQDTGSPDMFLYTPEIRKTKRVTGQGGGGKLFGTDFSYEDFARWQGLNQPGASERLPDAVEAGQPVWVVQTRPAAEAESSYDRVVFFVDQETCVTLKTESYERGDEPRKILTADPEQLLEEGGVWFASELLMRDLRDETHTQVVIEDVEVDRGLKDSVFSLSKLDRNRGR